MNAHDTTLTRFGHSSSTGPLVLAEDHPAIVAARPLFLKSANEHKRHKSNVLVSGHNSRKIGKTVRKGSLAGMPIYTLTLEERATCPTDCSMWRSCYGNRMPWALRWPAGKETEERIERQLEILQQDYPNGLLVRLHVLGDFYSAEYVRKWEGWLNRFPALHCYGYTARNESEEIGVLVRALALKNWNRFAIRSSGGNIKGLPSATTINRGEEIPEGIVCPVETEKTAACGTCALCWDQPNKTIVFLSH